MKKLISVIPIAILICILLSTCNVYAAEGHLDHANGYRIYYSGGRYHLEWFWTEFDYWKYPDAELNTERASAFYSGRSQTGYYNNESLDMVIAYANQNLSSTSANGFGASEYVNAMYNNSINPVVVIYNIPYRWTSNIPDGQPTPTPTPTPTPELTGWDKFYEWYYNIYGYYPADDSLFGYFRSLFEDDSESSGSGGPSQHSITTHRPAPTPTPTPIPYSISVVPIYDNSGNITNYIYNYTYTSESGETIVATSPPEQPNNNNTNNDPYNPDPLTVPTSALDAWYMFAYDENEHPNPELYSPNSDFGTGMKYVEDNINQYDKPIDYIMGVVNSFPDNWLLLFGLGISIIFIAGIIGRFLS